MKCPEYDQDLLLYAHRQLGVARYIRTALHLTVCRGCRERAAAWSAYSRQVASAVRPAGSARWAPMAGGGTFTALFTMPLKARFFLMVAMVAIGGYVAFTMVIGTTAAQGQSTSGLVGEPSEAHCDTAMTPLQAKPPIPQKGPSRAK